jgi:hypothetical protein
MKKLTDAELRLICDLSGHAAQRIHTVLRDVSTLLDNKQHAYLLLLNVISSMICAAALMHGGKRPHAAKIAETLVDLTDLMGDHIDHGGDDEKKARTSRS